MSDTPETPGTPAPAWTPPAAPQNPPPPPVADHGGSAALAAERPEIAVGAAFAGGLVFALILKRLAR